MDSIFVFFIFTRLFFQTYAEEWKIYIVYYFKTIIYFVSILSELPPSTCNFPPAYDTWSKIEANILSNPMGDTSAHLSYTCYQAWSTFAGTCLDTTPGLFSDNCKGMCKNAVIPGKILSLDQSIGFEFLNIKNLIFTSNRFAFV